MIIEYTVVVYHVFLGVRRCFCSTITHVQAQLQAFIHIPSISDLPICQHVGDPKVSDTPIWLRVNFLGTQVFSDSYKSLASCYIAIEHGHDAESTIAPSPGCKLVLNPIHLDIHNKFIHSEFWLS